MLDYVGDSDHLAFNGMAYEVREFAGGMIARF